MHELGPIGKKADITTIGKSIGGGMIPASGMLCDNEVMNVLNFGDHGSTYGGNPLAMAVARTALGVIEEEGLVENAAKLGPIMRDRFKEI